MVGKNIKSKRKKATEVEAQKLRSLVFLSEL